MACVSPSYRMSETAAAITFEDAARTARLAALKLWDMGRCPLGQFRVTGPEGQIHFHADDLQDVQDWLAAWLKYVR